MCFSAEASFISGILLVPPGLYCVAAALQKSYRYLPLALLPLLFGIQQLFEAGVWIGLQHNEPALVRKCALGFLFFAIAFWPGWIPFAAASMKTRPRLRRIFFAMALLGMTLGFTCYLQAAFHYGDWLTVGIEGHSIQYDMSRFPVAQLIASAVWQGVYLSLVCVPLLISLDRRICIFGITVAVAALLAHLAFRFAFASVWCFFAAMLSAQTAYICYCLPKRDRSEARLLLVPA
jgi:hypothetical protein